MKNKKIRIIPKLEIKDDQLIKTIFCEGLRRIGDPDKFAMKYYNDGADELFFIDNVASLMKKKSVFNIIGNLTKNIFIPITIGGGIKNLNDAENAFKSGADKLSINTAAIKNSKIIGLINNIYGNQSIVMHINAKYINKDYFVFVDAGRENSQVKLKDWITKIQQIGIGEIVLTSVDNEGLEKGFDMRLLNEVKNLIDVPLILSGGFGDIDQMRDCLKIHDVSGFALSSMLHYNLYDIETIKSKI